MGQGWDNRYRTRTAPDEPSELLTTFAHLLPTNGRALDLACGGGRNSVWLAGHGLEVTAIDSSSEALRQGRELAERQGRSVVWIEADLRSYPLPTAAFDLAVCFYYRDPALYLRIRAAMRPGGRLLYETYTLDQLRFASGPRNPDHLLRPGELLTAFADWRIHFYRETFIGRGVAALVARKPAAGEGN